MSSAPSDTPRDGSGRMFDAIAPRYDLLNRIISLGIDQRWRTKTVAALGLGEAPATVLDLATGTGDLALRIARAHPRAHVIGVDPSTEMLGVGRRKVREAGLAERVDLQTGDAEALPFDDDVFDATTIAFGIRNVPDRAKGLREMARVTRPGGTVAILELSEPRRGPMAPLARLHVHHVVPTLGAWLSGAREYRYLQRSIAAFPPPEEFAALMEDNGLDVRAVEPLTFGTCALYVASPRGAR
jgi:demethylmenaquinone methyltransferase/2-methoxy-6-polyprenyl-1,4-benzoquinol methylase